MKFEEDLILNNEVDDQVDYDGEINEEEEVSYEYFEEQLMDDLAISILIEFRDYCRGVGINMCERINVSELRDLLSIE